MNVFLQKDNPFGGEHFIGVAMTGSEQQRHTGLYYRINLDAKVQFLHLGFHFDLRLEAPKDKHCWLAIAGLDEVEQQMLAIWFEKIWAHNGKNIPYGIHYSRSPHFNLEGGFIATDSAGGLTCATFILALFEDYGFSIIDTNSARSRADDKDWHDLIINALKIDAKASSEYIENQRVFLGRAARFRPEEVAGATSTYLGRALSFDDAMSVGVEVLQQMRKLGGLAP